MIVKPYRSDELAARVRAVLAARRPPAGRGRGAERTAAPPARTDHPRRVLFVEDEVVLRMSTVDMLERLGCVVAAVGSGEQALEILGKGRDFDLLLTDLGLPGMTGEQLAAEVQRRFPNLPVIIASGYGKSNTEAGGPALHRKALFLARPSASSRGGRPEGQRHLNAIFLATDHVAAAFFMHRIELRGAVMISSRSIALSVDPGPTAAPAKSSLRRCTRTTRGPSTANCSISMSRS